MILMYIFQNGKMIKNQMNKPREKDPNFKKDVFEKKVKNFIECGHTRENAISIVLGNYNRTYFSFIGIKPNKRKTDENGYFI